MKNISQIQIMSICQETINVINRVQDGTSLCANQEAVKKSVRICLYIKSTRTKWNQENSRK